MHSIGSSHESVVSAWSALQAQWSDTRQQWRDTVGERFAREFWSEWESTIPYALEAVRDLGDVLDQALEAVEQE